jgi:hypothetical protein
MRASAVRFFVIALASARRLAPEWRGGARPFMARRGSILVMSLAIVIALDAAAHARCGDRSGDEAAVEAAAAAAVAACPCDDDARRPNCLLAAIREVARADGLRAACRHEALWTARAASCTTTSTSTSTTTSSSTTTTLAETLTGDWMLTGEVVEPGCGKGTFETRLLITQVGASLRAQGREDAYIGSILADHTWQLSVAIPQLDHCGEMGTPVEALRGIFGTLPDADGVATVEQRISFLSPVGPVYDPCPQCRARWQGTMVRLH